MAAHFIPNFLANDPIYMQELTFSGYFEYSLRSIHKVSDGHCVALAKYINFDQNTIALICDFRDHMSVKHDAPPGQQFVRRS